MSLEQRFWSKVQRTGPDECWLWQAHRTRSGYGHFSTWVSDHNKVTVAHRMAWTLTNGAIPAGLCVCHRCDNPPCCNPSHLFLGTQRENIADMDAKGRAHRVRLPGSKNHQAKLTEALVVDIRRCHGRGETAVALAKQYGVSDVLIGLVVSRRAWRHVP